MAVEMEGRFAERDDQNAEMTAELIQARVELLFAQGWPAAATAKNATTTLPVVFGGVTDPVAQGMITSLARPGGNLTGLSNAGPVSKATKRYELLKELVPTISRLAYTYNPTNPGNLVGLEEIRATAQVLGFDLVEVPAQAAEELDGALQLIASSRADAFDIGADVLFANPVQLMRILDFAALRRLPTTYVLIELVARGVFMSYGPDQAKWFRRGGYYVDRILRGAKPADLPVEQPTQLELAVNRHTAELLSLTIPPGAASQVTEWVD